MKNAPEFTQMIFHRSACERNFPVSLKCANLSRSLAVAVLDVLGFVQNHCAPFDVFEHFRLTQGQTIAANDNVAISDVILQVQTIDVAEHDRRQ